MLYSNIYRDMLMGLFLLRELYDQIVFHYGLYLLKPLSGVEREGISAGELLP